MLKRTLPVGAVSHPAKVPRHSAKVAHILLTQYHNEGRLDITKFDEGILSELDALGLDGATKALELYCEVDPASIRNHAGFLKGIINKVRTPFPAARSSQSVPIPRVPVPGAAGETYWSLLKKYHDSGVLDMNQLDSNIMADLEALSPEQSLRAVEMYVSANQGTIRNPCGFMKGIINSMLRAPPSGAAPSRAAAGALAHETDAVLSPMVQLHLDTAIEKGSIAAHQIDAGIKVALADLDPNVAIRVLADFTMTDPHTIQNKPGFLVSMIKKARNAGPNYKATSSAPAAGSSILDTLQELHLQGKVDMTEFDGGILRDLERLSYDQAMKAIDSFLSTDQTHIRNRMGFLKGIINLIKREPAIVAANKELDPAVRSQLDFVISQGYITEEQCDGALMASLAAFDAPTGIQILSEFMETDPETIQNKAGFLCGIMKRHRMGNTARSGRGGDDVDALLDHYRDTGLLDVSKLDAEIVKDLKNLPSGGASQALAQLAATDQGAIRNVSGFLKGIINKLKRDGISSSLHAAAAPLTALGGAGTLRSVKAVAHHSSQIFCPSCGLQQPRFNFCSNCGFSLGDYVGTLAAP